MFQMLSQNKTFRIMERKSNDFKLPQLKRPQKDTERLLSTTGTPIDSRGSTRVRPASSNKVQDLEKKLFSKLESYQGTTKKHLGKRTGKSIKQIQHQCSTGTESTPEGYEKMQKLMPALYSKFIEAKKGSYPGQITLTSLKKIESSIDNYHETRKEDLIDKSLEKRQKHLTSFPTELPEQKYKEEPVQNPGESFEMTEDEMNIVFSEYLLKEGLGSDLKQTTAKQIEEMNNSLIFCEKEIQKLKHSMSDIIKVIGLDELSRLQDDNDC